MVLQRARNANLDGKRLGRPDAAVRACRLAISHYRKSADGYEELIEFARDERRWERVFSFSILAVAAFTLAKTLI